MSSFEKKELPPHPPLTQHPMAGDFPTPRLCDFESIPWPTVKRLIFDSNLYELGRSLDAHAVYKEYMTKVRSEWASIKDFILAKKFGCPLKPSADDNNCKKNEADDSLLHTAYEKIIILANDFPYNFETNVKHLIIWKLGGRAITKEDVELHGKAYFESESNATDWAYFINPPELKSIPEIDHAHLLVQYSTASSTASSEAKMRLLIIGGTRFVGLTIAQEALMRGHSVTLFHRGITNALDGALEGAKHIIGDRNSDLSGLLDPSLSWDATIDVCAYRPHQVDLLADALDGRGGLYNYISTVSVFAEDVDPNSDEDGKKVDLSILDGADYASIPIDAKTYGPLKLLCEQAAKKRFGSNLLIIRPTYVFGPGDYTMRFPKWVKRISAGGIVDCPRPKEVAFQYIDARDQARFAVDLIEQGTTGVFNSCVSPNITFGSMLETVAATVGPPGTILNWVDVSEADEKAAIFPLWSGSSGLGNMMSMSASAAVSKGLKFRPLPETIVDTLAWLVSEDKA